MADFQEVLRIAHEGSYDRDDYPPYALTSWGDRARWSKYLETINKELDERDEPVEKEE